MCEPEGGANDEERDDIAVPIECPWRAPRHASPLSFGGENRKMKSLLYLVCSGCWVLFAIGCLALPVISGDDGAGIPLFGPAIGIGHALALVFLAGFCILVSAAFLLQALLPTEDRAKGSRNESE